MTRRRRAAVVAIGLLVLSTGCLGFLTGEDPLYIEADDATVSADALEETGYQEYRDDAVNHTREFSAGEQTREVTVGNQVHGYNRTLSLGPLGERDLGRFVVYSTPAVEFGGQTFNPVGDWSNQRLVEELSRAYEGLDDVQFEDNRTVTALGEPRTVSTFSGTSTVEGQEIDVRVHVTKFRHGDDFVVGLAVHPEQIDERDRIDTLIAGLSHPAD